MKVRHVKFIWGASKIIKGHWYLGLFGIYDRVEGKHDDGLAISVRGIFAWLAGAMVAAYFAFAVTLFWFWQRNPYSLLTFSDALLRPVRRAEVRDLQGQAFIAEGTDAMRAKHWTEAVNLLRQGLAYHPGDLRGRLTLAQFYVAANQRPLALKVMQEGLGTEFPGRPFLQVLFDLAEQGEDYDLVVRTGNRYLPSLAGDAATRDRRWLQGRVFAALLTAKRFDEALALAKSEETGDLGSEHQVLALLGQNKPDAALAVIREWEARPHADTHAAKRLRARSQREAKQFDAMDRTLDELRAEAPADPRPYVYGVIQRAMSGREASAAAALDDFLFRFGGTTQNLQMVAEPLAEIGKATLLDRVVAAAADRGFVATPYQVLVVQTAVQRGDWPVARRTLAAMKPPGPREMAAQFWHDWMERLLPAASTPSDTAALTLVDFLRSRPWPMKILRASIEALRLGGQLETARDVLAVAAGSFPASTWVAEQQAEVARLLAARQAAAAPAVAAGSGPLLSEKLFFERLTVLLRDGQWTPADELLREARGAQPAPRWVEARDSELRFAQIRVYQGRGDTADLVAAAKLYLNGDASRSRQVIDVGRAVFDQGDKPTAIAIAKEVLRATPDFAPAQRYLAEWQPKPPAAPKKK